MKNKKVFSHSGKNFDFYATHCYNEEKVRRQCEWLNVNSICKSLSNGKMMT